eukprot:31176-Pelagococcus_subviridis.AAC.67
MSSSVYNVARRLCAFTNVGAMLTAVPADDSASANLPSACSHAQMFERKRPSSIGAPFAIKSDSWYIASACWWFPWKNASLPSSLNSETLFARSRSCDRPSGSGMDASSASAASSSFSSSSSFSFSFASPPASSRFLFFSSAALSAGSICKRSTTCSPASTHDAHLQGFPPRVDALLPVHDGLRFLDLPDEPQRLRAQGDKVRHRGRDHHRDVEVVQRLRRGGVHVERGVGVGAAARRDLRAFQRLPDVRHRALRDFHVPQHVLRLRFALQLRVRARDDVVRFLPRFHEVAELEQTPRQAHLRFRVRPVQAKRGAAILRRRERLPDHQVRRRAVRVQPHLDRLHALRLFRLLARVDRGVVPPQRFEVVPVPVRVVPDEPVAFDGRRDYLLVLLQRGVQVLVRRVGGQRYPVHVLPRRREIPELHAAVPRAGQRADVARVNLEHEFALRERVAHPSERHERRRSVRPQREMRRLL